MTDKIHIRWEEFHQDVKTVCKKIKSSGTYNKIVAISRGGLLPAGIIAYELDIRNCHSLNIATYIGGLFIMPSLPTVYWAIWNKHENFGVGSEPVFYRLGHN